jgi:hypothetical protein
LPHLACPNPHPCLPLSRRKREKLLDSGLRRNDEHLHVAPIVAADIVKGVADLASGQVFTASIGA